ncbi:hypothetical protein SKB0120_20940 [Moraxella osloensis]
MLEYLDFASFTERDNGKKWEHKLYEPNKLADSFNLITYFIANDDVDAEQVQQYREATKTEFLIALNTTGKSYDCLKIADSIIYCGSDEIELAIYGLSFMNAYGNFIGIDWYDVKTALSYGKSIQFLHSSATGDDYIAVASEQLIKKYKAYNSNSMLKAVLINTFTDISFNFDQQEVICTQVEENIDVDEVDIFYQVNFFEEFDAWKEGEQGCCICMFLVYSDEEKDSDSVIIEHDIPKQPAKPSQKEDNAIQAYLRRQWQRNKNG